MHCSDIQRTRWQKSNPNYDNVCGSHLLQIEDVVVEVILQLLICIVDAELLEAVCLKVLEAKNVQNSDGQTLESEIGYVMKPVSKVCCCSSLLLDDASYGDRLLHVFLVEQCVIDAQHDPVKQGTVERFGHGVSGSDGLIEGRKHHDHQFPVVINSGK